jgi:uncharacterized protein (DUF58 family)
MPTKRAWTLLSLALVLYFLANQTQVGWLYIIADALVGLLLAALFYSLGLLKLIRVKRSWEKEISPVEAAVAPGEMDDPALSLPSFHEDDPIAITLQFDIGSRRPALSIRSQEVCPLAPVADRVQPLFIPILLKGQPVRLSYQTVCDRRGHYLFPELRLHSRGAFGLFHHQRKVLSPGNILVYPSYHPLKRLRAFERRELAERQTVKLGAGSQVISTREYRAGDSLRYVHWRSTARTGSLVVKEFSDDEQPTLTVVLDLATTGNVGEGKYSTFETAVRIAASLGYYAQQKRIPFYLVAASQPAIGQGNMLTLPATPLSWWAVLNYLAKIQNNGSKPLARVLDDLSTSSFVVVLVSHPAETIARALTTLAQQGTPVLAVFITPDGVMPSGIPTLRTTGLDVITVSPYNWPALLAE